MAKSEKSLSDQAEKAVRKVPAKSGLAGTLVIILILAGIIGIVILGLLLFAARK